MDLGNGSKEGALYQLDSLIDNYIDDNVQIDIIRFLDLLECPEDFRCLSVVLGYLEQAALAYPEVFEQTFNIQVEVFSHFKSIRDFFWQKFFDQTPGKGWMSQRPLYVLLLKQGIINQSDYYQSTLNFIHHYYINEDKIKSENRCESSFRAFRLITMEQSIKPALFDGLNADKVALDLQLYREYLMELPEEKRDKNIESYLRDLEHFYRLDWTERRRIVRISNKKLRSYYNRTKKMERIRGSDELYTMPLTVLQQSKFDYEAGLSAVEDFPGEGIVRDSPEHDLKPKHELPSIATIKDQHKQRVKKQTINQKIRRAHNLTLLSRNVLQPHELYYLLFALLQTKKTRLNGIAIKSIQQVILLTLYTGYTLKKLLQMKRQQDDCPNGFGIYRAESDLWFLRVSHEPTASHTAQAQNKALRLTKTYVDIQLPVFLVTFLQLADIDEGRKVFALPGEAKTLVAIQQFLESLNRSHSVQLSYKSVLYFLVNRTLAMKDFDPVILESLTGEISYYTRTKRHYSWRDDHDISIQLVSLWNTLKEYSGQFKTIRELPYFYLTAPIRINETELDETTGIGSKFMAKTAVISKLVNHLYEQTQQKSPFLVARSLAELIDYHNRYTLYTVYMLLSGTGYRAVHNPLPTLKFHLQRHYGLCISDKDAQTSFAHARIIALPVVVSRQLVHYAEHLSAFGHLLGGLISEEAQQLYWHTSLWPFVEMKEKKVRLDWFFKAKHSRGNDGVFFAFGRNDGKVDTLWRTQNVSPAYLSKAIPEDLRLPMNFGRHYLRQYLQDRGVSQELIDLQLGHWANGELPLGWFSSSQFHTAVTQLQPFMDQMMDELGWCAIPSWLTRKRK